MIILIEGGLGTGKSTLETLLGFIAYNRGRKVYSNYTTTFSEKVNLLDLMKLGNLSNCVILVDEWYIIADSRNSMGNKLQSYFYLQSRHMDIDLVGTVQLGSSVDVRIRLLADRTILCKKDYDGKKFKGFKYVVLEGDRPICKFKMSLKKASEIFKMFNTKEIIYPYGLTEDGINFDKVLEIFNNTSNKKSFSVELKNEIPVISYDVAYTVYDRLKREDFDRAKSLLGI